MKLPATLSNSTTNGNGHKSVSTRVSPAISSPLHANAFLLSDDEKVVLIAEKFAEIMEIMGLDLKDDSLSGTPERVAKMYIHETFQGLNPLNKPDITLFENNYAYGEMLVERNITLHSTCEHHFVPILGVCHVAYFATGKVVGLSKLNRIVKYYAKRPQVQERLTEQIAAELKRSLQTEDVAVYIDAEHLCVKTRGIEDCASTTVTSHYCGRFKDAGVRSEFLSAIRS